MTEGGSPPWYADGLSFSCRAACGACCRGPGGYVWVTPLEAASLARALRMDRDAFGRQYLRRIPAGYALRDGPRGDCILLGSDGCCSVYASRPAQCRTFPWWPEILESPETWEDAKRRCPGIGRGSVHALAEIEAARAEADQIERE